MKFINARSVLLPPITFPSLAEALLFTPAPTTISSRNFSDVSERLENLVRSPVINSTTESLPSVIVPVLSLKSKLRLPAVSRPLIFLTSTLSFDILILWNERSIEVSIGRPSGTAHTIIVTATVIASIKSFIHSIISDGAPPPTIVFNIIPTIIAIAPIYPNVEICLASLASLTCKGVALVSS